MWFWRKTYDVKCLDGTKKTVYKNVDDAFPLFIRGFDSNLAANVRSESLGDGNLDSKYTTKIDGLLYALDELNQGLMMTFRAIYMVYSSDPCGNVLFLQRECSKLIDEQRRLRSLKIQIDALINMIKATPDNAEAISNIFSDIVQRIGNYPGMDVTTYELQRASEDAHAMSVQTDSKLALEAGNDS